MPRQVARSEPSEVVVSRTLYEHWKQRALEAEAKLKAYQQACDEVFGRTD